MLVAERQNKILEITNERGLVTLDELLEAVQCSRATIRRDINSLYDKGLVRKTHGGVMSINSGAIAEPPLRIKSGSNVDEKRRIAAHALSYLEKGEHVVFDSGTTILELAKLLDPVKPMTIVTYDLLVAMEVAKHSSIDLLMVGGILRKSYYSFYGYFAEEMLSRVRADKAFISADTVDLKEGLMSYTADDIAIKKRIIELSGEVFLLCDHSKFENRAFLNICSLSEVDHIITGKEINAKVLEQLQSMKIQVDLV